MRISLSIIWLFFALPSLWSASEISVPVGIAKFIPLDIFLTKPMKWGMLIFSIFLLINYMKNQKILLSTIGLSLVSLVIFTLEESSGVFNRVSMLTMVWVAQSLAILLYRRKEVEIYPRMIHFTLQIIAVSYMMSAYSKWSSSGLHWVSDGKNIDLQIVKSFYFHWTDGGDKAPILQGEKMMGVVHGNHILITIVLWFSLILESASIFLLFHKKWTRVFGVLLFAMHVGIYVIMGILILPVILPMLIFTINPLYVISEFILKTKILIQHK